MIRKNILHLEIKWVLSNFFGGICCLYRYCFEIAKKIVAPIKNECFPKFLKNYYPKKDIFNFSKTFNVVFIYYKSSNLNLISKHRIWKRFECLIIINHILDKKAIECLSKSSDWIVPMVHLGNGSDAIWGICSQTYVSFKLSINFSIVFNAINFVLNF